MKTSRRANDHAECAVAARKARLHYVTDDSPGIRRLRSGKSFRYVTTRGEAVNYPPTLARIRKLAVPPAWSSVWISSDPRGHLQATGRDDRGRKQYRYHDQWRAIRDENKFDRLIAFAKALPRIRRRVRHDLKLPGLPREKILATVVRLLETTKIRVGNEEYARQNHSFGLTTLHNPHARVSKDEIQFEFRGKGGVRHHVTVHDRRLARIIRRCQDIPGQELFQYLDAHGKRHTIGSADVNRYVQAAGGGEFTAKDFRTWAATLIAARAFRNVDADSRKNTKRALARCIAEVAQDLGNTPTVCRKCYIHPALVEAYLDRSLEKALHTTAAAGVRPRSSLRQEEAELLRWLRRRHASSLA